MSARRPASGRGRELILALDQGSSSSRAIVYDLSGRAVASARRPVRTLRPKEGWAEHDPGELARSLEAALEEALAGLRPADRVVAAGLAVQRSTVVFCERASGKPVSRAPSWMDGRAAAIVAPLQARQSEIHAATGLYATPYYSAPKIRWSLDHDARVKALADAGRLLCAPVSTFLARRLTGTAPAADPTCAQRMLLMHLDSGRWDPSLLGMFGLSEELLPSLRPSLGDWGLIERRGRRIPLLATVGDQQSAAIGLGASREGDVVANYGTGAFLLRHSGADSRRVPGLLCSAGASSAAERSYFLEGTVHAAGASFEWLRGLGLMKDAASLDACFRRSSHRVLALPAIGGLGAPRWDYQAKTTWFGLTSKTAKDDLVRATAEGLCLLLSDVAEAMRAAGLPVERANVSGGLARSQAMMSFQADVLGAPLERRKDVEATALGAAVLAARQAGLGASKMAAARVETTFPPRMPEEARLKLRADWTRFVASVQRLSRDISLS